MMMVEIKGLEPGDILYRTDTGEPCELREIITEKNGILNRRSIGAGTRRYRFYGFDCYAPCMSGVFRHRNSLLEIRRRSEDGA